MREPNSFHLSYTENLQQELQPHATPEEDAHVEEGQGISEAPHYWKVLSPWESAGLDIWSPWVGQKKSPAQIGHRNVGLGDRPRHAHHLLP